MIEIVIIHDNKIIEKCNCNYKRIENHFEILNFNLIFNTRVMKAYTVEPWLSGLI